jgi:hypothetical protein
MMWNRILSLTAYLLATWWIWTEHGGHAARAFGVTQAVVLVFI